MKYNTISTSSLASEGKKSSTLTIYADMDVTQHKTYTESEMASIRGELEIVQKALKFQTKRCRQLVAEYTRRLQSQEQQYRTEKSLRDDQLAKVLRALLIFEARLKQEQKFISHQLNEKDYIIKKQKNDIKKLMLNQYCKSCNRNYYVSGSMLLLQESLEEEEYQSSNFESLDSSSETYLLKSDESEENSKSEMEFSKPDDSSKKKTPTYFEVLKLRNDSPTSNEDNTSNDYDNLDSLPTEIAAKNVDEIFETTNDSSLSSECITTVIDRVNNNNNNNDLEEVNNNTDHPEPKRQMNESKEAKVVKITETIPIFDVDEEESNETWYASASDQEDEEHRNIYRNNPVLECMNQILLQNINDTLNSPPKTPNIERKTAKKVKFSDEENSQDPQIEVDSNQDYYETPIQKTPNFYETPQSIYSNDYEQILSKCNETFSQQKESSPKKTNHYYIDIEKTDIAESNKIVRKNKILRTPPALPPKPANLVSKYKMQHFPKKSPTEKIEPEPEPEPEPDYCSISELNLPQSKNISSSKKINVVAEINSPTSHDVLNKLNPNAEKFRNDSPDNKLIVKNCVEKLNIQLAKQTPIKSEISPRKNEPEIPKLPQVSEIIIPDEDEEEEKEDVKEERIAQDNYVKNNSQILKLKSNNRAPIVIGSSVSSLITGFNNQQFSEIKKKPPERGKLNKHLFSSFETLQNVEKHSKEESQEFDLSQNFEEFKLDDCDMEEYIVDEEKSPEIASSSSRVELIRATDDEVVIPSLNKNSIDLMKKQLAMQKQQQQISHFRGNEPTYEHFLECTGLSTKSILNPSARILNNHKSVLKPKDVKLRSKVKATNNVFERHNTSSIKYWSEPYI